MLLRIQKWVPVENVSDREQRIVDIGISGGEVILAPGEQKAIPAAVWCRVWRRSWIQRTDTEGKKPDFSVLPMHDIRRMAKEVGLTIPIKTKKAEIITLMAAKSGEKVETPAVVADEPVAVAKTATKGGKTK
jgi:hypothetical protein